MFQLSLRYNVGGIGVKIFFIKTSDPNVTVFLI